MTPSWPQPVLDPPTQLPPAPPAPPSTFDSRIKPVQLPFEYTFQGGTFRLLQVGSTPGNIDTALSPGPGYRWMLFSGRMSLTTDATVANRYLRVGMFARGGIALGPSMYGIVTAASVTKTTSYHQWWTSANGALSSEDAVHMMGNGWIIEGDDYYNIAISAGVAGDRYSGILRVLEVRA